MSNQESSKITRVVALCVVACVPTIGCASTDDPDSMASTDSTSESGSSTSEGTTDQPAPTTTPSDPSSTGPSGETEPGETSADESTGGDAPEPGAPLFDEVEVFSLELPVVGDPTDIYAPIADGIAFPVALLLQGANVDKQYYAETASLIARYGFIVVVPNHTSIGFAGEGLFMEQSVIPEAIEGLDQLDADADSPLFGRIDTGVVGLLGHSYGGVVGVYALTEQCQFPFCVGTFTLPSQIGAGVFFGTNMRPPFGGAIDPLPNAGRGIGLVQGTLDSKATLADAEATYEQIATAPAALVTLAGANHYGINDVDNPPGADPDDTAPQIEQDVAIEITGRWSALLLRAWLLDDTDAQDYLQTADDPNVETQFDLR